MNKTHWFQKRSAQLSLGLLVVGLSGAYYWYSSHFVSTDNAYVNANIATVAPQISGTIKRLTVNNHQFVAENSLLLEIDPEPFHLAVQKAQAEVALARQTAAESEAAVRVAQANLHQAQAQMDDAERSLQRTRKLVAQRYASTEDLDKAVTTLKSQTAAFESAAAHLEEARIQQGLAGDENAAVQEAVAALKVAELNLAYTQIKAPCGGQLINLSNRPGDVVQTGQPLFAIISQDELWVDTNFKETQLSGLEPGQKADIELDSYPGQVFKGVVEHISGGSGAAFSLLPPQNATGNWVKVTQRFPVKIRILQPQTKWPLRVGMSANVTIHLTDKFQPKKPHDENPEI